MSIVLFLTILGLFLGVVRILPWPESPGAVLAAQLIAAVVVLFGPVLIHAAIATWFTRRAITAVAKAWCMERGVLLERAEMHKNHFTVVFKEGTQTKRAKFRVKFIPTTWIVRKITWL